MVNINRNDPCHYGSGKKYKKCCADADQQRELVANKPGSQESINYNPLTLFEEAEDEIEGEDLEDDDLEEDEDMFDHDDDIEDSEPYEPIVTAWWDEYRSIEGLDEERAHLDKFLETHPHLVDQLGLEHETLLAMGCDYLVADRVDEYVTFLMNLRGRFPVAYKRAAGYCDFYIISWLISKGRGSDIKNFLNYFIDEPVSHFDQFHALNILLLAVDETDELIPMIREAFEKSDEILELSESESILRTWAIHLLSQYIKDDVTDSDIAQYLNDLKKNILVVADYPADEKIAAAWKKQVREIRRPFVIWKNKFLNSRTEIQETANAVGSNFMRYMHEGTNVSLISARYYGDLVCVFLTSYWNKYKSRKGMFQFDEARTNEILRGMANQSFDLECITALSTLTSLYHFAAYLYKCENLTFDGCNRLQVYCREKYVEEYPGWKQDCVEALCFATFPVVDVPNS
ncbi:MAG: SEC-C metal-binding domain-containing protein [Chryseolinea sp.]